MDADRAPSRRAAMASHRRVGSSWSTGHQGLAGSPVRTTMADKYVGRSRLSAGEGTAEKMFRHLAETDLETRCIDVMLGRQEEARNATEANVFRLVCDHVLGSTPGEPKDRLVAAASRYFGTHPEAEWSVDQVVLREWPASLVKMRGAILLAAEEGAARSHVIETSFTESEVTRLRAMAAEAGMSVADLIRRAALTASEPIDDLRGAIEITQGLRASVDRSVPAVELSIQELSDRVDRIETAQEERKAFAG